MWNKVKKFSNRPILGRSADPPFFKTARKMGPQIHELAFFFIKWTPFEIKFCVGNCSKFFKSVDCGPFGRPPQYVQNGPQYGAQNTRVGIFSIKLFPFHFGFCTIDDWKIFKLVHFGPIGRPYFSKRPAIWGPKQSIGNFFSQELISLKFGLKEEIDWKI